MPNPFDFFTSGWSGPQFLQSFGWNSPTSRAPGPFQSMLPNIELPLPSFAQMNTFSNPFPNFSMNLGGGLLEHGPMGTTLPLLQPRSPQPSRFMQQPPTGTTQDTSGYVPTAGADFKPGNGQFSPYDSTFAKYAGDQSSNPELIAIIAAGTKAESGWNASNQSGDNGHSWGLFQMHDQGAGYGMGAARLNPDSASAVMVPKYVAAYKKYKAAGMTGAQLAAWTAADAERPENWNDPSDRSGSRGRYISAWNAIMGGR